MYKKLELAKDVPASIPTEHPTRDRKNYSVDKSLEELGIDGESFNQKLQPYLEWCTTLEGVMQED